MRLWTILPLLLTSAPPLPAQQGPPAAASAGTRVARAVDANALRSHLEFLADDALEGRAPSTRGGDAAAAYIAAQFRRLGLEPAGDGGTYFHRVPIISLAPEPVLAVVAPASVPLEWKDDYVLWSMRNDSTVAARGDLVFAGYGIVAPEYDWNDYAGQDVKGKYVAVLVNDPGLKDSTIFRGKVLTYYGRWTYKIEEAQRQGAAGILLVHTLESATYPWTTVLSGWTRPQVRLEAAPGPLAVAGWLHRDAAARLFKQGGQDLDGLISAAAKPGFKPVPLQLQLDGAVRSTIRRSETANVLGRIPGRGSLAREAVIIGGHYDHLGIGAAIDGDSVFNGAEDNASGTAAVLAAAEAFVRSGVRTGRSLLFVGFAAEESGLLGSEALAENPPIPLRDIAAILNLDVLNLYGRTRDVSALGLDQSTLGRAFGQAALAEGLQVSRNEESLVRGYFFRTDHFPFARVGVPGTSIEPGSEYVGRPAGWGKEQRDKYLAERYHQPGDEFLPWFTYDGLMQQLRVTLRTAVLIGNAPQQPTWARTSEFREAGERRKTGAAAILRDTTGASVGHATFSQATSGAVTLDIRVAGLAPGSHGVHLHAVGSCGAAGGNAFGAAGGHFNPSNRSHGMQNPGGSHAGDFPNLEVGSDGTGRMKVTSDRLSFSVGETFLDSDGAAIVVHAAADDQVSDPAGNSGARVACGVVSRH